MCGPALGPTRVRIQLGVWLTTRLHLESKANNHSYISTRMLGLCGLLLCYLQRSKHPPPTPAHSHTMKATGRSRNRDLNTGVANSVPPLTRQSTS